MNLPTRTMRRSFHWLGILPVVPLLVLLLSPPALAGDIGLKEEDKLNPLEFVGTHFLGFYWELLFVAAGAAIFLRWHLRKAADVSETPETNLEPYEVAYLAGRELRAGNVALASMVHQKVLRVDATENKAYREGTLPSQMYLLERAAYEAVNPYVGTKIMDLRGQMAAPLAKLREQLQERELVLRDDVAWRARFIPFMLMLAIFALGMLKLGVGVTRARPVGFLIATLGATAIFAPIAFLRTVHRSRRGDKVLRDLQTRYSALQATAKVNPGRLGPAELPLALGLFGLEIMTTGPVASLQKVFQPVAGSGCGVWVSCGGGYGGGAGAGCGGGGGGGCGGGGGGGCGGCGGV